MKKKLIVVGGRGYIGRAITAAAQEKFDVVVTSSSKKKGFWELNLEDPSLFDFSKICYGDVVLLAASISSPDVCNQFPDYTRSVNVVGTCIFIEKAIQHGARIIFFSSDTVYGHNEKLFSNTAKCNPSGFYAQMKRDVELRFEHSQSFKAIRLSYVFSSEDKFSRYLIGCLKNHQVAELFHPFSRAVIHREDVVLGVLKLAENWNLIPDKLINFGGPSIISRIEFAECFQENISNTLKVTVTEPKESYFKNRPRMIAMTSPVLETLLDRPALRLNDAVRIEFASYVKMEK